MAVHVFGAHRLDTDRVELRGPDGPVPMEPQVYDVLRYLVEHPDRLVTKEELLDEVWGDRFVSEAALTTRIKQARRVIGDDGTRQSSIRTVRGRGFRFIVPVTTVDRPGGVDDASTTERPDADRGRHEPGRAVPRELVVERGRPFAGRHDELSGAAQVLARTEPGPTAWLVLLGEPGIGKTRLAVRMAELALERGADVLFGRCSEDLAVPYQPFIEALRTATTGLTGDQLRHALGPAGAELARLLPDLADRVHDLPPPSTADPETERHRLFEAVAAWLRHVAAPRGLLLVVDDVHWATDSTLLLLDHLARSRTPTAVTFAVTARDTSPDVSSGLLDLVARLDAGPNRRVVRLHGLDVTAAAELLGDMPDVAAIVKQTAGNPLLMQAVAGEDGTGPDVDAAVRRRLARLGDTVRETLTVASVVGLEFELAVVAAALGRDVLDVLDDLEDAVAARLLDDIGADTYRFAHGLVRASLRDALSSGRRARWHGRVLAALEERHGDHLDGVISRVANHAAHASVADPDLRPRAVVHLRAAARSASDQLSFAEAVELLERARRLVDPTDRVVLAEIALQRGDAQRGAGSNLPAIRSYDAAFTEARLADRADLMSRAAMRYEDVSWRPGLFGGPSIERILAALERLEATPDGAADVRTRARLLVALTRAHHMAGDTAGSEVAFAQAMELLGDEPEPLLEVEALSARHHVFDDTEPVDLEAILRLRRLADDIGEGDAALLVRQLHLRTLARVGRFDAYRASLHEMAEIVGRRHSSFWDYIVANHEAQLALYEGDLVEAEEANRRCEWISERMVDEDTSGVIGLRMFVIRREQDRLRQLAPVVRQLVASSDGSTFWTPGLAVLLAETGHRDAATAMLDDFVRQDFDLPTDALWSTVMAMLAELAHLLEHETACRVLAERLAAQSGLAVVTGGGTMCLGSADRHLGMLAAGLGELDVAEEHLRAAVAFDDDNGGVLWAAHAKLQLANVLAARGVVDEADALRGDVVRVADARGFAALARQAIAV